MNRSRFGARACLSRGTAAVGLALLGCGMAIAADLPTDTYRGDTGRSGYYPGQIGTPLSLLWKHTTAPSPNTTASPIVHDGIVYISGGPYVFAVRVSDGSQVWRYPASTPAQAPFVNTPTYADGAVYIGGDDQQMYKLDAKTGNVIWKHQAGGAIRTPAIVEQGRVFFGSEDGSFDAIDVANGQTVWTVDTGGPITAAPSSTGDGQVAFASTDNKVYCVDEAAGRTLWAIGFSTDATASPPVYVDGTFYLGSGRDLYALASRRGNTKWTTRLPDNITTATAVTQGQIFLGTEDNKVYGLSDRGRILWTQTLDYPSSAVPLVVGNTVIFPTGRGLIYAFDASTGRRLWQYSVQPVSVDPSHQIASTDIDGSPIFAGNTLFVASDDGSLSAFQASAPDSVPPVIKNMYPAAGSYVNGKNIYYSASVVDEGSGIDPSSVSLKVDGKVVRNVRYVAVANGIQVVIPDDPNADADPVPVLPEGPHQAQITATDWRGNTATRTWGFTVDNNQTVPPRRSPTNRPWFVGPGGPGMQGFPGGPMQQGGPEAPPADGAD